MGKYYAGGWEGDYEHWDPSWDEGSRMSISIKDSEPSFTGLLMPDGRKIYRTPRPIGFGRDEDW